MLLLFARQIIPHVGAGNSPIRLCRFVGPPLVEVERTTEALDQSDRAGSSRLVSVVSFSDQMRGNDTLDDTQHATGDLGPAGEQET